MGRFVGGIEARLQTRDFLGETSDGLLGRLVLFEGNVDGRRFGEAASARCANDRAECGSERRNAGAAAGFDLRSNAGSVKAESRVQARG